MCQMVIGELVLLVAWAYPLATPGHVNATSTHDAMLIHRRTLRSRPVAFGLRAHAPNTVAPLEPAGSPDRAGRHHSRLSLRLCPDDRHRAGIRILSGVRPGLPCIPEYGPDGAIQGARRLRR